MVGNAITHYINYKLIFIGLTRHLLYNYTIPRHAARSWPGSYRSDGAARGSLLQSSPLVHGRRGYKKWPKTVHDGGPCTRGEFQYSQYMLKYWYDYESMNSEICQNNSLLRYKYNMHQTAFVCTRTDVISETT